MRKSKKT